MKPMKPRYVTAAGSVVLALVVASPAIAAEDHGQPLQAQPSQLPTMRVDQLTGMKVVNEKGQDIGKVESVVRHKTTHEIAAVVGVGGFLGIARHDVTIALHDLTLHGDRIMAPPGTTEEHLKRLPEYKEADYEKLPGDQIVTVGAKR